MSTISDAARGLVRRAGLAAVAAVAATAMSHGRAEALSLASPAALPSAKYASEGTTIEVRGGHHGGGGFRGGGGGFRGGAFHGGGFRGGGMAFRGGGFRTAPMYRGGGGYRAAHIYRAAPVYRHSGGYRIHRHAYGQPYFHRRHHVHRRHFVHRRYYAPVYTYPRCTFPYRYSCRVVWTHYGPRKICRCRLPVRHYYWRYGW